MTLDSKTNVYCFLHSFICIIFLFFLPKCADSFVCSTQVRLSCRGDEILDELQASEEVNHLVGSENQFLYRPEYAAYMVEGTPGVPYGGLLLCCAL